MEKIARISTSEPLIEALPMKVLSVYYFHYANNINGVLHADRKNLAKKLGISPATLYRQVKLLREHDMLQLDQWGNDILIKPKALIEKTLGYIPSHKCTLNIRMGSNVKTIQKLLRKKLLERLYRQAQYSQRETKIKHNLKDIHSETIKRKESVKLRKKLAYEKSVPIAGSTIADNLGMSLRAWKNFQNELIQSGYMTSQTNRELVKDNQKPLIIDSYGFQRLKEFMGNNLIHTHTGNVIKVNPNLISIKGYMNA
jgi:hypothetical protein